MNTADLIDLLDTLAELAHQARRLGNYNHSDSFLRTALNVIANEL